MESRYRAAVFLIRVRQPVTTATDVDYSQSKCHQSTDSTTEILYTKLLIKIIYCPNNMNKISSTINISMKSSPLEKGKQTQPNHEPKSSLTKMSLVG